MLRFVKGSLRRLHVRGRGKELRLRRGQRSGCRTICLSGLHECEDQANEYFGGVGNSDIVMLAFRTFPGQVGSKGGIPVADKLCGVKQRITKVTSFHINRLAVSD